MFPVYLSFWGMCLGYIFWHWCSNIAHSRQISFNPNYLGWKIIWGRWVKVGESSLCLLMLWLFQRLRKFNNVLHFKHFVIVIMFDQCFKASLLIERMKSNYKTLLLSCYSRPIMFFIFPPCLLRGICCLTLWHKPSYFEWLKPPFFQLKPLIKHPCFGLNYLF